jgi:hypothetical protein
MHIHMIKWYIKKELSELSKKIFKKKILVYNSYRIDIPKLYRHTLLQVKVVVRQCDKVNDDLKIILCTSPIIFYLNKNTVINLY